MHERNRQKDRQTDKQTNKPWNGNIDRNGRNRLSMMSPKMILLSTHVLFACELNSLMYYSYLTKSMLDPTAPSCGQPPSWSDPRGQHAVNQYSLPSDPPIHCLCLLCCQPGSHVFGHVSQLRSRTGAWST